MNNNKEYDTAKIVLLITATILPQDKRFLMIKEPKQRLQQYLDCLSFFIVKTDVSRIVLCDNSNYDFPCDMMGALAERYGKKLEIIQFTGNTKKIAVQGKGYGEGELIKYALNHSVLLRKAEYFIKVTGRLKVLNINQIIKKMDITKIYINKEIRNFRKYGKQKSMNTVLYGIPRKIYLSTFADVYIDVCDKKGIYLEHVFYDRIVKNKLTVYNIPHFPVINGVSGSLGSRYQESIGRERCLYELLSRLFLFNCDLLRDTVTYISGIGRELPGR